MYFEVYEVPPVCHPLIEQSAVMGFHQLIAPLKFVIDPTRYVQQALRCQTPMIAKPPIASLFLKYSTTMYIDFAIDEPSP